MYIIAVLCGWIEKDGEGVWHSSSFENLENHHGAPGSKFRVIAAGMLYKNDPDSTILTLGGKGQLANVPDAPPISLVAKRELIETGVPAAKITAEVSSVSTYSQLLALRELADSIVAEQITILSNNYHMPRVKAMVERAPRLEGKFTKFALNFITAEDVLLANEPQNWRCTIRTAYEHKEMRSLIMKEEEGAKKIREGTYKFS